MPKTEEPGISREDRIDELGSFLLDRWMLFEALEGQLPWSWEMSRWYELVFCILVRLGEPEVDASTAWALTSTLVDLDLLDVETVAEATDEGQQPDFSDPELDLLLRLVERFGFSADKARAAVTAIFEAALSLNERHDGKVQYYLRAYGEHMLAELRNHFQFSGLSEDDIQYIFAHWLQNVLNMPVVLAHPAMDQICDEFDLEAQDIVDVADDLDLNVALLDDILAEAVEDEEW
jgi:hypothetical protein